MKLPNFLMIGAAKSATTSLHEYLSQHPDVFMSRRKEPNYFAFPGRVPDFRGPDDDHPEAFEGLARKLRTAKYRGSVTTEAGYRRLFRRAGGAAAVGESSVSYLFFEGAAQRIRATLPEARLIAILRNPVDRAYSKFQQFRRQGLEPLADFAEAFDAEEARVRASWSPTWFYRMRGLYCRQLEPFYQTFGRDSIKILLYDDFAVDPLGALRAVFRFLDVDDRFVPDVSRRYNTASRHPLTPPAPLSAGDRRRVQEAFRADTVRLQNLIDRDLSSWLEERDAPTVARGSASMAAPPGGGGN